MQQPIVRRTARGHLHAEAFCLMGYATDDNREMEAIWNSRDGVTPFIVRSRSGLEMQHVDWNKDVYEPIRQPRPGDRIFVDLTPEVARQRAEQQVERYWDDPQYPMSQMFDSRESAIETLTEFQPGAPMLIEVGPEGWSPEGSQRTLARAGS